MNHIRLSHTFSRIKTSLIALMFIGTQLVVPLGATGLFVDTASAVAATNCVKDTGGVDDINAAQKDLTRLCVDYAGVPNTIETALYWDETGTPGVGQSLDACNLFDTNGNGNADYAVCVTTQNNPATLKSVVTYSCTDSNIDRCASPNSVVSNGTTVCTVTQVPLDPFPTGDAYPLDTQGACTIQLSTVGGQASKLIDVCSYPSSQPNSSPSDCVVARPSSGKLEVRKTLVPAANSGRFNLQIDGTTAGTGANVGDTGTTGELVYAAGSHIVGETAVAGTNISAYTSTISCKNLSGTGTEIGSGNGTSLQLTLVDQSDVVCIITNTINQATVTVTKVVNTPNGGNAVVSDFPLFVGATEVTSGVANKFLAGVSYTVTETLKSGYQQDSITCVDTADPGTPLGATFTPTTNQNIACTVTNSDIAPTLALTKIVDVSDGGSAVETDWTLKATPSNLQYPTLSGSGGFTSTAARSNLVYTLSETGPVGYTASNWSCTGGGSLNGNQLTLYEGQSVACSIMNDDIAPTLTLIKKIIRDDGGTETADQWTLKAQHDSDTPIINSKGTPNQDGSQASTLAVTAKAGINYSLSETGPAGYTASLWTCDNGVVVTGVTIKLAINTNVTCTITNNDIAPKLIVIKKVINNNSGIKSSSDFEMIVSGTSVPGGLKFAGSNTGVTSTVKAGTYNVSEGAHIGYTPTLSADCTGSLALAETKTCTITNNDEAHPEIKVVKSGPDFAYEAGKVIYTFAVTNTGDTEFLSDVTVNDSIAGLAKYESGDANSDSKLQKTETWLYSVEYVIPAGQIANVINTATTCANDPDTTQVCDTDEHTLDVLHPSIAVTKSGPLYGFEGQTIGYTFVVTNTGDTVLTGVGIDDDIAIMETCDKNTLAPGATANCTASFLIPTPQSSNVVNTVTASGTDPLDKKVTAEDDHTLDVLHPIINVAKSGPSVAHEGDKVLYNFSVTNTGDIPLNNVTVIDNVAGTANYLSGDTNLDGKLDQTETWLYSVEYTIPADRSADIVNTVTVCGQDPARVLAESQVKTCNTDTHTLDVLHPSIEVVKSGPDNAYQGDEITYTFTVTNTGDTALAGITALDTIAGQGTYKSGDTNTNNLLDLTETWLFEADYTVPSTTDSNITNTVKVCGKDQLQLEDCADDSHELHVYHPSIKVTKVVVTSQQTDDGRFNLLIDGTVAGTGENVGDGGSTGKVEVEPGNHTINESAVTGTNLSDYSTIFSDSCSNGEVTVTGDDQVECVITNTRLAKLIVVKDALPQDQQNFNFQFGPVIDDVNSLLNIAAISSEASSFTLDDDAGVLGQDDQFPNTKEFTQLAPGDYSVSEQLIAGWDLSSVSCSNNLNFDRVSSAIEFTLEPGSNSTCTFTNTKHSSVTVVKDAQPNSSQPFTFTGNLTGEGQPNFVLIDNGDATTASKLFAKLSAGTYTVTEPNVKGWSLDSVTCLGDSGAVTNTNTRNAVIKLDPGENVTCTFVNKAIAPELTVIKQVVNTNGNNKLPSDFNMIVTGNNVSDPEFPGSDTGTKVTLDVGDYAVTEDNLPGYIADISPECTGTISLGDKVTCTVTNTSNSPLLNITKTNDRPEPTVVGDTVTYTLVVTVPENSGEVFNSSVTDLPPDNFTYVAGSWTAQSSDRGDLKASGTTTEPTYASPGVWQLGNLLPGEIVTLTYRAVIGSSVSDGTYPDLAFVQGRAAPSSGVTILGNINSSVTTPFVGTRVSVITPVTPQVFTAGQVLGAEILVNTGTNLLLLQYILPFLLTAGVVISRRNTYSYAKGGK